MIRPIRMLGVAMGLGLALGASVEAAPPARQPQRALRARPAAPLSPAERYRRALLPVRTCGEFAHRFAALPEARPLLRALFAGGIPDQREAETQDGFVDRIVHRLFVRLGDPSRIYTNTAIGDDARYDPASGTMTITLAGNPYLATLDADSPRARAATSAGIEIRASLEFPPGTLPGALGVRMPPGEAAAFLKGAGRLRVLSLLEDYGTDPAPASGGTATHLVRLKPHCALLTSGSKIVKGWSYDDWMPETGG